MAEGDDVVQARLLLGWGGLEYRMVVGWDDSAGGLPDPDKCTLIPSISLLLPFLLPPPSFLLIFQRGLTATSRHPEVPALDVLIELPFLNFLFLLLVLTSLPDVLLLLLHADVYIRLLDFPPTIGSMMTKRWLLPFGYG